LVHACSTTSGGADSPHYPRRARARDPLITVSGLEHALEKHFQRGVSRQYVSKIADKVAREALVQSDRTQIEERMNFTRENHRMMRDRMLNIIYWQPEGGGSPPYNKDVIEAAKNVVMMDLALLAAQISNDMYKKPIDAIEKEFRYDPLPPEVRTGYRSVDSWRIVAKGHDRA